MPPPQRPSAEPAPAEASRAEYRIEKLAEVTGVTVRMIREFQDKGLVDPPERRGRVAFYNSEHLTRLELILSLQKRGYGLAGIRDLLDAWASGHNLEEVLGLTSVVSQPWTHEAPVLLTAAELGEVLGEPVAGDVIEQAVRQRIMISGDGGLHGFRSQMLLEAARDLMRIGIPLGTILEVIGRVQAQLEDPAELIIGMVWDQLFPSDPDAKLPVGEELNQVTRAISGLRPHAMTAVEILFGDAMTDAISRRYQDVTDRVQSRRARESVDPAS